MPNAKKNNAVEFVYNIDLSQKVSQVKKTLENETRGERREELQAEIDKLVYQVLVKNKESLGIDETLLTQLTLDELRKPQYEDLYKTAEIYAHNIPRDRANVMLKNNLEGILSDIPQENLDDIGVSKEFNETLANDELVHEYSEIVNEAMQYKATEGVVRKYKKGEKLDEKEEKFFYGSIAESVGEKFKTILKNKGFSEESQDIGAGIAALSSSVGLVKKDIIDKSADRANEKAKEKFRDYETKQGKKLVDYVKKGITKLVKDKDTDKYNVGLGSVYSTAKRYVVDNKLDATDEDYFRLLAA